ncbi:MAG: dockerin type I repeat-containing protein [Clostridia bacterium]|nr:dockerin type I repeat-containing protein [Clostridia bacterium]
MKRKIVSCLLTICMIMSFVSVYANADSSSYIMLDGKNIVEIERIEIKDEESGSITSAEYNAETNELILYNFLAYSIVANNMGDLKLIIKGTATVAYNALIDKQPEFTVKGGNLSIISADDNGAYMFVYADPTKSDSYGIYVDGDLSIYNVYTECRTYEHGEDCNIDNSYGLYCGGNVLLDGSHFEFGSNIAENSSVGIYAESLDLKHGNLYAYSSESASSIGVNCQNIYIADGSFSAYGNSCAATSPPSFDPNYHGMVEALKDLEEGLPFVIDSVAEADPTVFTDCVQFYIHLPTLKEIIVNDATLNFKIDDRPIFTASVPDEYKNLYEIDYEAWENYENNSSISSTEHINDHYISNDINLIDKFEDGETYYYTISLKNLDENVRFGYDTKLVINDEIVDAEISVSGDGSLITFYHVKAMSFMVTGDVNCDGIVTMEDVTDLQKVIADIITLESLGSNALENADCNYDAKVTMEDVTMIQKYLAKLIEI